VTAGQGHIGHREPAIAAGFMTEAVAGMLTYAGQALAGFVTQRTLVIVKVCVTLSICGEREKAHNGVASSRPYRISAIMSAGELELARK
jgi:hypothetical protein